MAQVEALELRLDSGLLNQTRMLAQPVGTVEVDHVTEVQAAAVQRAQLRQQLAHRLVALGRCLQVGALEPVDHAVADLGEQVAAAAGGDVDHRVDIGLADALDDFTEMIGGVADAAGFRIANVQMDDAGPGTGGVQRTVGDLLRSDRKIRMLAGSIAGTGDSAGEDDVAIHERASRSDPEP